MDQTAVTRAKTERLGGVDAARIIAALGTVWQHTVQSHELANSVFLGRFAVPFFGFVAGWFLVASLRRAHERHGIAFVRSRFERLMVPFLLWTAIYFFARLVKHLVLPGSSSEPLTLDWQMFIVGSAHHLWFLSFLFCASVLAFWPVRWAVQDRRREVVAGWAILIIALVILLNPMRELSPVGGLNIEYWFERCWTRGPTFLWGMAAALIISRERAHPTPSTAVAIGGLCLLAASVGYRWFVGTLPATDWRSSLGPMVSATAGLGLALFAFYLPPGPVMSKLRELGAVSFGVYLIHVLFVEAIQVAGAQFVLAGATPPWFDVLTFVLAVILSYAAVVALKRSRVTAWLVP